MFKRKKDDTLNSPQAAAENFVPQSQQSPPPGVSRPVPAVPVGSLVATPTAQPVAATPIARPSGPTIPSKPTIPTTTSQPSNANATGQRTENIRREVSPPIPNAEAKKLTVSKDIKISGSISACDRLVVEGTFEADLKNAISLEILDGGIFRGEAEVDEADIAGTFEGTLLVHKKLNVRATGRIKGTIRYTRLSVDVGGQLNGTLEFMEKEAAEAARPPSLIPPFRPEQ